MKVSVIIPTYNYGEFIEEAINSVLNQSWQQFEIIVVDDGSTDNTTEVLSKFSDKRIYFIKTNNRGVSAARNTGLDAASGDFIAFLDADDRWLPSMLEKQLTLIEADPEIVCVFCNFIRFNNWNKEILSDQFKYFPELAKIPVVKSNVGFGKIIQNDAFCHLISMNDVPAFTPMMLFRKRAVDEIRFNTNLVCCEDTHFVLKVFLRGKVAYNEEVLAEIRRHNDNATKDLEIFAKAKLMALKELSNDIGSLSGNQRRALEGRLLKAYANFSYYLLARNRKLLAWQNHYESLSVGKNSFKKLRVTIKLIVESFKNCLIKSETQNN